MKYSPPDEFMKIANPEFSDLDTIMFQEISSFPEDEKDLISEIHMIAAIEFPDDDFDKRTIKNQWPKYLEKWKCHINTPPKLVNIFKLVNGIFYNYEIKPSLIKELQNLLQIDVISSDGLKIVDILEWYNKKSTSKNKNVLFACALVFLYEMSRRKFFSEYNITIALLLFKKILSDAKIIPLSYPIVREININSPQMQKLGTLNKMIVSAIANISQNKSSFDCNFWESLEKQTLSETNLKQSFEKNSDAWKNSILYNTVKELLEANNNNNTERILFFFEQVWVGNQMAQESYDLKFVTEFISAYNQKKNGNHINLFLFINSIVQGLENYSLFYEKIRNHQKLKKANQANPKKKK